MTFARNANIGDQAVQLRLAMMQLSKEGYEVLEGHAKSRSEQASVLIDKPYNCDPLFIQVSQSAGKNIGWCEQFGVRIYWKVAE